MGSSGLTMSIALHVLLCVSVCIVVTSTGGGSSLLFGPELAHGRNHRAAGEARTHTGRPAELTARQVSRTSQAGR